MSIEIRVPLLPESVSDATIAIWIKQEGDIIEEDDILLELETDKVVLEVSAPASGVLAHIIEKQGAVVISNEVIGLIEAVSEKEEKSDTANEADNKEAETEVPPVASPSVRKKMAENDIEASEIEGSGKHGKILKEDINEHLQETKIEATEEEKPETEVIENTTAIASDVVEEAKTEDEVVENIPIDEEPEPPVVIEKVQASDDEPEIAEDSPQETKQEEQATPTVSNDDLNVKPITEAIKSDVKNERRVPMTRLRSRIAERLVEAQQTAAILTTFNDVDLSEIIRLRKIYRDRFERVHGIKLGFMSFFVKASTEALKRYPEVNARIDGQDIIYQGNYDIGVAVSTERGLVVPVLRDTNTLGHAEIEKNIHDYAHRARNNQLELNELTGGTFSITNGGVFGSMLSTPIINPPQSAILGMHKIEDRPVAINGEVVIRPMMYLALSYDHRLIDGKTAVSFLVKIKELLEDPASLFLEL
ncbi:MAG: dihydrolipoyllysine-residue succinyltransferase [Aquificaceae bacterium]|nr:MAG: dihydrolipoyllysine-residue succinyltransferase [Aquificaceae bacterium]